MSGNLLGRVSCWPFSIVALTAILFASGCQTDSSMSLENAKYFTAQFTQERLNPPPKTIALLLKKLRKTSDSIDLADCPEIDPFLAILQKRDPNPRLLSHHASVQFLFGNYRHSIRLQEEMVRSSGENKGRVSIAHAKLAIYYAHGAEYRAADSAMSLAENTALEINSWRGTADSFAKLKFFVLFSQATVADALGDVIVAEAQYRKAIQLAQQIEVRGGFQDDKLLIRLSLARNLARQGRFVEAEIQAHEVLKEQLLGHGIEVEPLTITAITTLAEVLFEQGRYDDAAALGTEALKLFRSVCALPESQLKAQARNIVAKSLVAKKRWKEALTQFEAIRKDMANDLGFFDRRFVGDLDWSLALLRIGKLSLAKQQLTVALERAVDRYGDAHYRTQEVRAHLAMVQAAAGERAKALDAYLRIIPLLLKSHQDADESGITQSARGHRLVGILEAFIELLIDIRGKALERRLKSDAVAETFRLANFARSQIVSRALSASSARASAHNPELAQLARREQDAKKQVSALYATLQKLVSSERSEEESVNKVRAKIKTLRAARATIVADIEKRFPSYAALINPKPATVGDAQRALHQGEALITTYVGEKATYVWAVPKVGKVAFTVAPIGRDQLGATVTELRRALDPQATTLGEIPAFDVALSHRLYKALLKPVVAGWNDAKSLMVVAHGALGQLPFSVLITKPSQQGAEHAPLFSNYRTVPFLTRSHAVTVLPSVSALATLRALPAASPKRRSFAGFGDPVFGETQAAAAPKAGQAIALASRGLIAVRGLPVSLRAAPKLDGVSSADLARLPRLPDTAEEVRSIALAMNADLTRDVFTGAKASEGQVKSMTLSGYKVLAFATHGLVPGDLNGLTQPALALSSPKVTGGKDDGLLTMGEILSLKLDADWVVLSACNTASGNGAGAEAVSGLGRAFFYAGTRALLVSNWPVETTSAKALTTDIFKRQANDGSLSRADALRQSMLNLIDKGGMIDGKGNMVFSYAHPIFWAPFSLVGDGGGGKPAS